MSDPSAQVRVAGLRGLNPLDEVKHARFKTAADYGFVWSAPVYPVVRTEGISSWGMDGNGPDPSLTVNGGNPVGDCGVCAVPAHANMLSAVLAGLAVAPNTMTSDQVVTLYFTYQAELAGITWRPPATGTWIAPTGLDNGVDLGDWLLWLFQQGLIEGFVKVPLAELDAALATFGVVIVGVNLNPQADQQFSNGQPWNVGPGDQPDPTMGHAILYLAAQSPSGPFEWCSWGATQPSTLAWKQGCVQQAFAVLTKPEAQAAGFPLAVLAADLKALGGTVALVPAPPAPVPAPKPVPSPSILEYVQRELEALVAFIARYV